MLIILNTDRKYYFYLTLLVCLHYLKKLTIRQCIGTPHLQDSSAATAGNTRTHLARTTVTKQSGPKSSWLLNLGTTYQRLKVAPHWHMAKHCRVLLTKTLVCGYMHEKMQNIVILNTCHNRLALLRATWIYTGYKICSFQRYPWPTEKNTLCHLHTLVYSTYSQYLRVSTYPLSKIIKIGCLYGICSKPKLGVAWLLFWQLKSMSAAYLAQRM